MGGLIPCFLGPLATSETVERTPDFIGASDEADTPAEPPSQFVMYGMQMAFFTGHRFSTPVRYYAYNETADTWQASVDYGNDRDGNNDSDGNGDSDTDTDSVPGLERPRCSMCGRSCDCVEDSDDD